jgi:hypothetical protein
MKDDRTPQQVREPVRTGILTTLERDIERRGGRTARLLATAGVLGVSGGVGLTLLLSRHPFGHHPSWHVVVFSSVWAGLLVVCVSLVLLEVRTSSLPLARSVSVGILGLALAGICGALCPDQHFLRWWSASPVGGRLAGAGGLALSALCFGGVTALFFGAGAAFLAPRDRRRPPLRPFLPAAMLLALLAPGIALQSIDTSWAVFSGWLLGSAGGAYAGVASGVRLRSPMGASGDGDHAVQERVRTRRPGSP